MRRSARTASSPSHHIDAAAPTARATRAAGRRGAAALPRAAGADRPRADPRLRRAARPPKLRRRAQPTPSAPTISFARGAPSLDIVDVEGLRDAAIRAFESDPGGHDRLRHLGRLPPPARWIADRHGVEPERVLVTNGSMQADAFLFEHLVRPGDEVIVERPDLRPHAALAAPARRAAARRSSWSPTASTPRRSRDLLGGAGRCDRSSPTSSPTSRTPPGTRSRWPSAERCSRWPPSTGSWSSRTTPTSTLRFSGETLPTMLSMDPERVVYASSFSKTVCPGIRVGYLVGPPELIAAVAQLATNTYISPSMVAQSIVYEFCASGAIDRSIETVRTRARRARDDAGERAAARAARGRVRRRRKAATSCG